MTGTGWRASKLTGVLFDLDDTLVDHRGAVDRGLRVWLGGLGLDGSLEEHVERWFALETHHYERWQRREIGFREQRRARIRAFLPHCDLRDDAVADDVFAGFLACYRAAWSAFADAGRALAGALEAGLRVGILTNGDQVAQEDKLRRTGLATYGVPVFASSSLPAAKPDPRAFHRACAALGVEPAGAVMVGDSLRHDVRGARAAGLEGVLVDRLGRYDRRPAGVTRVRSLADLAW
ncbi:HAD family hydrolase [Nocardioides sp. TF02-7]|uniref:HAD family hydrolase n=1 Tax=Nocardioides sp. TF02-7 TaxID=2917724 RepID=UPI001F05F32F|nr:HAD family hydrolase [Nocardioides sp. TF02-7]UMG93870.1 HAD family hydrolase [Nocardioides sp. TF02-7]